MKISSFFTAGLGTAGAQSISMVFLPFLTRLYSPADFAPWAVGVAFVVFIGAISTLRYDLALVIERDLHDASTLFWITLLAALSIFACAFLGMAVAAKAGWLFHESLIPGSIYLVSIWLLLFMLTQIWSAWHLHHGAFLIISLAQLGNALFMNLVQYFGAIAKSGGSFWLVSGSLVGQGAALIILMTSGMRSGKRPHSFSRSRLRLRELAWKHRRFVHYSLPYTFFGAIRDRIPVLLLGFWTTGAQLGLYSQAWRLSNVPAGLSGSAIRPVLFHGAASEGFAALEKPIIRILSLIVLLGTPLLAIIVYKSEFLFGWILGKQWRTIGPFLAAMAFPAMAFSLSNWMDRLMDTAGKQHFNLWTEMISGMSSTIGLLVMVISGAGLFWGVVTQSTLLTLNYLFFIYLTFRVAGYQLTPLWRLFLLALILFTGTWLIMRGLWPM